MALDLTKLKQLREATGVSFSLCKKALEETDNNIEQAKKKLTEWGVEKVESKSDRITSQGVIGAYVHHNKKVAGFIELQTETDFVSGNEEFKQLAQELAMQVASVPTENIETFLEQPYIRDAKKTVNDLIKDAVLKFGENIKIARLLRWELGKNTQ